jgi:hypothetical protein
MKRVNTSLLVGAVRVICLILGRAAPGVVALTGALAARGRRAA